VIGSITLTGIKSIRQATANLAPLTILIGPNGSGKSTVLEGIELIHGAATQLLAPDAESYYETERSPAGIRRGHLPSDPLKVTRNQGFGAIRGPKPLASVTAKILAGWSMGVVPVWGTVRLTFPGGMPGAPAYFTLTIEGTDVGNPELLTQASQIISLPITRADWPPRYDEESARTPIGNAYSPPEQGPPHLTALRDRMSGALEIIRRNSPKSTRLREIGMNLFGADWTASHPSSPELVESRAWRVAFEEASFGTRQFFPAVVHLLALKEGETLLIEEPEISLHPRAQLETGRLLVEASQGGRQVVATTHSHYVILGVLHAVRQGVLQPDDVAILECQKGQQGTRIVPRPVQPSGNIDGWIRQFARVDEYVFQAWMDSLEGQPGERVN
jgi:energy-coupling factor transporter ATP-binding protein EcfA2